jgi:hypothetical protein
VRTAVGVALVIVCLGLTGCSLFGKKRAAQNTNPKPFLGSETPAKAETAAIPRDNGGPLPGANGVLAGRVIVEATGRPVRAYIAIKNRDREDPKAEFDVTTNDEGYFTIPKLNVGDTYELVARANENGELISHTTWVKPPNPTLLIRLDRRFTTQNTPPPPDMPKTPDKKTTPSKESAEAKPAVSIDPPVRYSEQEPQRRRGIAGPPQGSGTGASTGGGAPADPANIAGGDFQRITPPSVPVDIPNGNSWPPPPPGSQQWESVPEQRQPTRPTPSSPGSPGSVHLPNIPTTVPSCGFYGDRLDNFALNDLDGSVWEYKRDRRGRLMLLDFWYSSCTHCLQMISDLTKLQEDYGSCGLEIVSIACETGKLEDQRRNVLAVRGRYGIKYRTLLSGGGPERCPVVSTFRVERYPRLFLFDSDGKIVWSSPPNDGMDVHAHRVLRKIIDDRLVTQQSLP